MVDICQCFSLIIEGYRLAQVFKNKNNVPNVGFVQYRSMSMYYRFCLWTVRRPMFIVWTVRRPFLVAILGQFVVLWRLCLFPEQFVVR